MDDCNIEALSPRPPTPPESDFDSGVTGLRRLDTRGSWGYVEQPLHHKSHSVSGGSPISPISPSRDRTSHVSFDMPVRPSSTVGFRRHDRPEARGGLQPLTAKPSPVHMEQISAHQTRRSNEAAQRPSLKLETGNKTDRALATEEFLECEPEVTEMIFPAGPLTPLTAIPIADAVLARPPSPRPALRSVQSWLNSSLQPCPRAFNDDLTRVVPLPPDAMETLRVSIACFPETMLLSSSLTIETIRTYSRKVRQPSLEILRAPSTRAATPESRLRRPKDLSGARSCLSNEARWSRTYGRGRATALERAVSLPLGLAPPRRPSPGSRCKTSSGTVLAISAMPCTHTLSPITTCRLWWPETLPHPHQEAQPATVNRTISPRRQQTFLAWEVPTRLGPPSTATLEGPGHH